MSALAALFHVSPFWFCVMVSGVMLGLGLIAYSFVIGTTPTEPPEVE